MKKPMRYVVMIWLGFILVLISRNVTNDVMGWSMLAVGLLGAFVGSLMLTTPYSSTKIPPAEEVPAEATAIGTVVPPKPIEPPKPATRRIIQSLTVTNNRTNNKLVYYNRKDNPFGLDWQEYDSKCLVIRQNLSEDKTYWEALGRFTEHSVIRVAWDTYTITPEEITKLEGE